MAVLGGSPSNLPRPLQRCVNLAGAPLAARSLGRIPTPPPGYSRWKKKSERPGVAHGPRAPFQCWRGTGREVPRMEEIIQSAGVQPRALRAQPCVWGVEGRAWQPAGRALTFSSIYCLVLGIPFSPVGSSYGRYGVPCGLSFAVSSLAQSPDDCAAAMVKYWFS